MGFNLGTALGGATQSAERVWQLKQDYDKSQLANAAAQNQLDNTKGFQQAMQNVPQVGAANTGNGPTGYTDAQGAATQLPTDPAIAAQVQRQGGANPTFNPTTQADQNQYVQQQALKFGQVSLAGQYALQTAEANKSAAQTTGQNQSNSIQNATINAYKDGQDFNNQVGTKLKSGNVSDAGNDVIAAAAAHGVGFTHFTNAQGTPMIQLVDNTGRPQGQPYDFSQPQNVQLAASAVAQRWGQANVAQANPSLGIEQQKANASTTQASAQAQNSDTTRLLAPSEITRNLGSANASNAQASEAPSTIALHGAQVGNLEADAARTGVQTTGYQQNNDQNAVANTMKDAYDANVAKDPTYATSPAGQAMQAQILQREPGTGGARAYAAAQQSQARQAVAKTQQQTKVLTGAGGKPAQYSADPNTPGLWVNKTDPTQSVQYDMKGNLVKVNMKMPTGATPTAQGIPQARNKAGQTAFQGHDGKWYGSQPEAAATYQQAPDPGAGSSPPPLVNGNLPPIAINAAGQPAPYPYPGLPNQ